MKFSKNKLHLWMKDLIWYLNEDTCFNSTYPPSFYITHTQEEIDEIEKKFNDEMRKKIAEL